MHTHIKTRLALWAGPGALALLAAANACSAKVDDGTDGLGAAPGVAGTSALGGAGGGSGSSSVLGGSSNAGGGGSTAAQGGGGPIIDPNEGMGGEAGNDGDGVDGGAAGNDTSGSCATVNATAELEPVYLAFTFDVSGSMGDFGEAWYDPALKWEPAVQATRTFLEDETSAGLFASLTTFPTENQDDTFKCDADNYDDPDVPMTELPSTAFGERLDAIRASYWGNGTPTRAALDGVNTFVSSYREDHPGRYAVVLVTDGYPQDCGDVNTIETIEGVVSATAADDLPTYVIGVKNPPITDDEGNLAPDTVSDLDSIAEAGGTQAAYIIDTGDPEQTKVDFRKAIDAIRGAAIACSLDVPKPPDGRTFQKDHVVVSTTDGADTTELKYDQDCKVDGAWRYDSTTKPSEVVLCPSTCTDLQDTAKAKLRVGFTCEQVITVR